jgi:hypothetical protein
MRRSTTIFLQVVTVLIGIGALTLLLWEPHIEGRNAHATLVQIYLHDPFLAYVEMRGNAGTDGTFPNSLCINLGIGPPIPPKFQDKPHPICNPFPSSILSPMPDLKAADPARPISIVRSIGAVFAGMIIVVLLSVGTDALLRAFGVFPPGSQRMSNPQFVVATIYRTLYTVFGAYITATLAPARPMQHALFYGFIGFGLSVVGFLGYLGHPEMRSLGPAWYPVALIVTALPCAWLGGYLRMRRS